MSNTQRPTESELAMLEDNGIAFDPTTQHIDLSKDEKLRVTALFMAINAYQHLIIKDADLYVAICREQGRNTEGPLIRPATINEMVVAAMQFEDFISGKFNKPNSPEESEVVDETQS